MKVFIVRHAIAMDREISVPKGIKEEDRPLTPEGKKKFTKSLQNLKKKIDKVDLVLTSPLVRAVETAKIFKKIVPVGNFQFEKDLVPGKNIPKFVKKLIAMNVDSVAIVGHEPHLGHLASYLLTHDSKSVIDFKKGGIARIDIDGAEATLKGLWN